MSEKNIIFTSRHLELIQRLLIVTLSQVRAYTEEQKKHFIDYDIDRFSNTFGHFFVDISHTAELTPNQVIHEFLQFEMYVKDNLIVHSTLYFFQDKIDYQDDILKALQTIEGHTFRVCQLPHCDTLVFSKAFDVCQNDFLYSYTRKERCSICLENHGSWTRLPCKHFIHTSCYEKLLETNEDHLTIPCPLCRTPASPKKVEVNYLFLESTSSIQ